MVAGNRQTLILLIDNSDVAVLVNDICNYFDAFVCRSIINQDDLKAIIFKVLIINTFYTRSNIILDIVHSDNYT